MLCLRRLPPTPSPDIINVHVFVWFWITSLLKYRTTLQKQNINIVYRKHIVSCDGNICICFCSASSYNSAFVKMCFMYMYALHYNLQRFLELQLNIISVKPIVSPLTGNGVKQLASFNSCDGNVT